MENIWYRALDHFLDYLPDSIDHWIVCLELPAHTKIFKYLLPRLGSTQVFILGSAYPDEIKAAGERYFFEHNVGYMEFVVRDGTFYHSGLDYSQAVMPFAQWPNARVKSCFDIYDDNFAVLFSENPLKLARRCHQMRATVSKANKYVYEGQFPEKSTLYFDCSNSLWVTYSGLEDFDYILPCGEVACMPKAVDGILEINGWIIGTVPFGVKYGRIQPGDLYIQFKEGRVRSFYGNHIGLCKDFEMTLTKLPGLCSVGELGLGQSFAVQKAARTNIIGCLWHERHFGIHIGLGAELAETDGPALRATSHHLDIVLATGVFSTNMDLVMKW